MALISVAYRVPCLSLCVRRTLTLFQGLLFQGLRHFSRENAVHFAELRHVSKNHGAFFRTNPAQTIKVRHVSYQKVEHNLFIIVAFVFDVYCTFAHFYLSVVISQCLTGKSYHYRRITVHCILIDFCSGINYSGISEIT